MPAHWRFGIWMAVLTGILMLAGYAVWYLREKLLKGLEEDEEEEDSVYTTAQVESLWKEGLLNDEQYERLKSEAREAAKRRAGAAKKPKKKRGIFG